MGKKNKKVILTPEQIKLAANLAGIGCNLDQIAAMLDIGTTTLDEIIKRDPLTARAISKGRSNAQGRVMKALFNEAVTGKNMTATIFYLKTRCRWAESKPVDDGESTKDEKGDETPSDSFSFEMNYKE